MRPLPFELAAFPRPWFGALGLPVVSYALPALIAIGQVIQTDVAFVTPEDLRQYPLGSILVGGNGGPGGGGTLPEAQQIAAGGEQTQGQQLAQPFFQLGQEAAALARGTAQETLQQLVGLGGAGDRRSGEHGGRSNRCAPWDIRPILGHGPSGLGPGACLPRITLCSGSMGAAIQFFRGVDEPVVPDIRLTRSRDGLTGQALFVFQEPEALAPETMGDITGMFMVDEEGELVTRKVDARFVNGKASALEATYTWKTTADFERFMRFAQRYADSHDLGFSGQGGGDQAPAEDDNA